MTNHERANRCGQRRIDAESLRAVVFEPAGVLFDATSRRRRLWQLVTRLGLPLSYDDFIRPWDAEFLPTVHRAERSYTDALHWFLSSLRLSAADLSELEAAVPLRNEPLETGVRPMPGAVRALNRLSSQGLLLAVLSDSSLPGNELKEQLDGLGLGGRFGVVVTSADLHTVKPARQNYEAVLAAMGLRAQQCAMVAGNAGDLAGACECGWRTIACGGCAYPEADASIATIGQLAEVVSDWTSGQLRAAS